MLGTSEGKFNHFLSTLEYNDWSMLGSPTWCNESGGQIFVCMWCVFWSALMLGWLSWRFPSSWCQTTWLESFGSTEHTWYKNLWTVGGWFVRPSYLPHQWGTRVQKTSLLLLLGNTWVTGVANNPSSVVKTSALTLWVPSSLSGSVTLAKQT